MGVQNPAEELLDDAIEATFPASDPVAVEDAWVKEKERQRRRKAREPGAGSAGESAPEREPRADL